MCVSIIYVDIYLSPLHNIGGYINWPLACHTSQSIVLTPTPCLAKVQAHLHGKNSKQNRKNRKVCKRSKISVVQGA